MIEITMLGTSSMVPTKERNHPGIFIRYNAEGLLFDCGESIQRQFTLANIPMTKVTKVFISHWHGDHTFGLPGLISSLGAAGYDKKLKIYGPEGTKNRIKHMFEAFIFDKSIEIEVIEIKKQGKISETDEFTINAYELLHGTKCYGFQFIEKDRLRIDMKKAKRLGLKEGPHMAKISSGKDIVYEGKKIKAKEITYNVKGKKIGIIADTKLCNNCNKIAKDADVLISESTYTSKLEEKGEDYNHLTAKQAALIASKSNAKKLILYHFSARYKDIKEIEKDAKDYFENSVAAWDLMKVEI